jgi:acetylornithine deacetylase/succinyl-diaminopimelate desuccinylase-like protein
MSGSRAAEWEAGLDWGSIGGEALERLRDYVRFPTVNDPDAADPETPWLAAREADAAAWLADWLRAEGVPCELLEPAAGRTTLVARVGPDDTARSVTLLSHSDVVPVVPDEWDVDPFAAEIRDGWLYGRGTLDLKGLGVAQLIALVLLRRQGVPLRRAVVAVVAADEENGGGYGAEWLVRERPEFLDTDVVLGEGGFSPTDFLPGVDLHAVAVAEKGYLELELTATGDAHHASMPLPGDAPARLVEAVARVLKAPDEVRVTPAIERLFAELASSAGTLRGALLRRPRLLERIGGRALPADPMIRAMLTETCAVTILSGGYKSNVVPGRARAVLSMRLLPGGDADEATERIRRLVDDPGVTITRVMHKAPTDSPFATADFETLSRVCAAEDGARMVPILSPGGSDARYWRAAGVPSYGWVPFTMPAADVHSVHGPNERVAVDSFTAGLRRYYRAVAALAMSDAP